jgi:uncharacterized membrane protein YeaQ/YmgE (transglycosylase-associated protein family)
VQSDTSVRMRLYREKDAIMTLPTLLVGATLTPGGLLAWLIAGSIAGLLTGFAMRMEGYRLTGDILVGMVGAFLGGWLASFLGLVGSPGLIGSTVLASLGACILVAILHAVTRRASRQ